MPAGSKNGDVTASNGSKKEKNTKILKQDESSSDNGFVVMSDPAAVVPQSFEGTDEILDPFCDPASPKVISFQDITSAAFLIKDGIERTPCPVGIVNIESISLYNQKFII